MNEPTKNRVTVYEVERFCERLHKLVIETHPSLGEPSFSLETGTLRVSFPDHELEKAMESAFKEAVSNGDQPTWLWTPQTGLVSTEEPPAKARKSKKVPQ